MLARRGLGGFADFEALLLFVFMCFLLCFVLCVAFFVVCVRGVLLYSVRTTELVRFFGSNSVHSLAARGGASTPREMRRLCLFHKTPAATLPYAHAHMHRTVTVKT